MALIVNTRKIDGVVIIDMNGRMTCGEPQMKLRDTLQQNVDAGHRKFVLNLSKVSFVDSSGLGELVAARNTLAVHDGQINLVGLTNKVRDVLVVTKLVCVFESFDKESVALAALQHEPQGKVEAATDGH